MARPEANAIRGDSALALKASAAESKNKDAKSAAELAGVKAMEKFGEAAISKDSAAKKQPPAWRVVAETPAAAAENSGDSVLAAKDVRDRGILSRPAQERRPIVKERWDCNMKLN